MTRPLTWVIGSRGLLGSAVLGAARLATLPTWQPARPIRWASWSACDDLSEALAHFVMAAGGRPWQIAWCAGVGVVGATAQDLDGELRNLSGFLEVLSQQPRLFLEAGALFVASSAGGVYAGAAGSPFDETSPPCALSAYGEAKLAAEQLAIEHAGATGLPTVIGRMSNLYGPGQDLAKPQGLISQICRAHLLREPLSVYVPLDTLRDYLFAPDCGRLVVAALDRRRFQDPEGSPATVKILASGQAVTVAAVLGELRRIFRRAPRVVFGYSQTAKFQVLDLRFRSCVWPELELLPRTTLPAGIQATIAGQLRLLQQAQLRPTG